MTQFDATAAHSVGVRKETESAENCGKSKFSHDNIRNKLRITLTLWGVAGVVSVGWGSERERDRESPWPSKNSLSCDTQKFTSRVFLLLFVAAPTSVYRKFSVKKRKDDNNELANNISIHRVLTLERESESGCWYRMRSKDTEEIEKNFAFHSCVGMLSTFSSTLECERFGRCSVSCGLFREACHRGLKKSHKQLFASSPERSRNIVKVSRVA